MTIERGELDAASTMELVQAQLNHNTWLMNKARDRIRMLEAHNATLEAALRRIDAINDSPARFSADIHDVCCTALAPEQDK